MRPTCTDIESARTWRCKVCTTSLAVNAPQPKCHWTPFRRLNVHVLPSGLMLQSVASIGTKLCHGSSSTRASYTGAYHIPPDLVVDRWISDGESGSHSHFLFRQDVWTMFRGRISKEITSTISTAWHFTTKSGGMWKF